MPPHSNPRTCHKFRRLEDVDFSTQFFAAAEIRKLSNVFFAKIRKLQHCSDRSNVSTREISQAKGWRLFFNVPFGDGGNPSPLGEASFTLSQSDLSFPARARAGNPGVRIIEFLDAPVSSTGQAYQVRHDKRVDFNQPDSEPLVL
jgi:hypothetical protein